MKYQYVYENAEAAKSFYSQFNGSDVDEKRFRLYEVTLGDRKLFVYERFTINALGRAAEFLGYKAEVVEGKRDLSSSIAKLSDEQKRSLLEDLKKQLAKK